MKGLFVNGARVLGVLALGAVTALFACSSSDAEESPETDGGDAGALDARANDGSANDAGADAAEDAEVDDGDFVVPDASVVCEASPCITKVIGDTSTFCALSTDGQVFCWGENFDGQVGKPPDGNFVAAPSLVPGLTGVTDLGLSAQNVCARVDDGGVYCWGDAQLVSGGAKPPADGGEGLPPFGPIPTPVRQDALPPAETVSVGLRFACMVASDGSLDCWGENESRQLGRGFTEFGSQPPGKATLLTRPVVSVSASVMRTFAITPEGELLSWGTSTSFGSAGFLLGRDTSVDPNPLPTVVPRLARVRGIGSSTLHSCAVAGRFVYCWGRNDNGQLGRGGFENNSYAAARTLLAKITDAEDKDAGRLDHDVPIQVATGISHSCAVLGSGRVYCWGNAGEYRVLGRDVAAEIIRGLPTRVDGFSGPAVGIAAVNGASCALLRTGAVECWGRNQSGQLGIGSLDDDPHPSPTPVSFPR